MSKTRKTTAKIVPAPVLPALGHGQKAFEKRWGITYDEGQELLRFKARLLQAVDHTIGRFLLETPAVARDLAYRIGAVMPPKTSVGGFQLSLEDKERSLADDVCYQMLARVPTRLEFIQVLQYLFWSLESCKCPSVQMGEFADMVSEAMKDSPTTGLRLRRQGRSITIEPAGSALLDTKVVDETLTWLQAHPKALKSFQQALQLHLSGDQTKRRAALDSLRHSLEQLLRSILGNNARLEQQREHVLPWLRERRVNQEAINMLATLLDQFAKYQNAVVKHDDKSAPVEVEFLIYLTGTFMRFLLEAEREFKTQLEILAGLCKKASDLSEDVTRECKSLAAEPSRQRGRVAAARTKANAKERR